MFRFLLVLPDGEPAIRPRSWPRFPTGASVMSSRSSEQLRVLETQPEIAEELIARGFNGVLASSPSSRDHSVTTSAATFAVRATQCPD